MYQVETYCSRNTIRTVHAWFSVKDALYVCMVITYSRVWINRVSRCSKKNLNASRPIEHPPVKGKTIKRFRWDHIGCKELSKGLGV